MNGNHATCPEVITSTWKYWSESKKRWKKDSSLTAECSDGVIEYDYEEHEEEEHEDYNEEDDDEEYIYGDYFYSFDYSQFSVAWLQNLKNND